LNYVGFEILKGLVINTAKCSFEMLVHIQPTERYVPEDESVQKSNYLLLRRMASSGILRLVALAITDISEELSASFIRVTRIGVLGTTLAVTSN
jgi:hypothetical protein